MWEALLAVEWGSWDSETPYPTAYFRAASTPTPLSVCTHFTPCLAVWQYLSAQSQVSAIIFLEQQHTTVWNQQV